MLNMGFGKPMQMSQKGTTKIENDKKDMIIRNLHIHVGRMEQKEKGKRRGEERRGRSSFWNYYFSTITLMLPLEAKGRIACL